VADNKKTTERSTTEQPVLRSVCSWCQQPKDGLGPVLAGELVSNGACRTCELAILATLDAEENHE